MWPFIQRKIWNIVSAIALSAMLVAAVSVQAATVTSTNDTLTTLEAGETANHTLLFTTPSGIDEGDTLTISFAADFDTSTITEDDVDIEDDGVDLTTAANCLGTEKASVTIAADIVTITVCTGDSGAIAATSEVTVEIGTNATASGTGANQIVNPSNEGTYYVSLAGTFGDSGSIALPIGGDNSISVQAVISGGGGGTDPGRDSCTDHTAPIISGITTSGITSTSATITWTTDENADSNVDYGLTAAYEIGTQNQTSLVTAHSIVLSGLVEGGEYHFRLRSSDFCHNSASSSDYVFTTLDITPPIISNIEVVDISETSARIIWDTNEAATSVVEYGLTTGYGTIVSDGIMMVDHSIILVGLTEGAAYHFRVSSADASSNSSASSDQTFTTSIDSAPGNVSAFTATAGDGQNVLSWNLPIETDLAGVLILSCLDTFPSSPTDTDCSEIFDGLDISFIHSGLTNDTTYYYGAFAYDAADHYASGALAEATPMAEAVDVCGDDICGTTESSFTCLTDCPIIPIEVCGDGTCDDSETSDSCPADCPIVPIDICGDEICGETETLASCPADCSVIPTDVCGNEVCESTESTFTCPVDCVLPPEEKEICGDGICNGSETIDSCAADCLTPTGDVCSNAICEDSETSFSCPADCGETIPTEACGNAICEVGETSDSCPSDCPSIEIPPTTVAEGELISTSDVSFFAGENTIKLTVTEGLIETLAKTKISIVVSNENIIKEVKDAKLFIGTETYLLSFNQKAYSADVTVPATATRHALYVVINYADGTSQTIPFVMNVHSSGLVFENLDKQQVPVGGTLVTLYILDGDWVVWDGSLWNQFNPITTNDGSFSWYVTNGDYKVVVQKNGYNEADSGSIHVVNQIVNPRIKIVRQQPTIISVTETVQETVRKTVTDIVETTAKTVEAVRQSPAAQTTASIAIPVVTVGVATSAVILATSFDLLPFLQLLFTSPLLLFKRRKRKAYGIVYHAFTKTPIDLAIVRLYRISDNKLIMSRVTDRGGRYFFMVQPDNYRLEVTKQNFVFPSQTLMKIKDDAIYLDVYHGEPITASDKDTIITPNIPLEPMETAEARVPWKIRKIQLLRHLQKWFSIIGLLVSLFVFLFYFSVWSATLLGVQIIVYLLVRRLATPAKPKSWGIVYDKITGRPLTKVVVRIFEPTYHKLLETWITDSKGRYAFILGPSQYVSTFEKTGYHPTEISPIDLSQNKDVTDWAQNVEMNPKK